MIVVNANCTRSHEAIMEEAVGLIRSKIGAVCAFRKVVVVDKLPKTRSGKILRCVVTLCEPFLMFAVWLRRNACYRRSVVDTYTHTHMYVMLC